MTGTPAWEKRAEVPSRAARVNAAQSYCQPSSPSRNSGVIVGANRRRAVGIEVGCRICAANKGGTTGFFPPLDRAG